MNPPYPPLPSRRWREAQPDLPISYAIDLTKPVFHVGHVPVYARPNGIGVDWLFQLNGVWKDGESTQAAVSDIEYLTQFDFTRPLDVLVIDLMVTLTVMRKTVACIDHVDGSVGLVDVTTLGTVGQYYRMAIPYAAEVEADLAQFAVIYNGDVEASRDRPGGRHDPDRYIATNWKPTYTYIKGLRKQAIFAHSRFLSTIGRRK